VNVAEGEAPALIQGEWASRLVWSSPVAVSTVAALQLLVWHAGRRGRMVSQQLCGVGSAARRLRDGYPSAGYRVEDMGECGREPRHPAERVG